MSAIALLLTGTVGVGKSTTAEGVGEALQVVGVPHAVIDLDAIRCSWPTPADDPFGFDLELRNLAPLVTNFLMAGAQRLVLAGVCESQRDRERYQTTLGTPLVVCRLRAPLPTLRIRLTQRHAIDPAGLAWHLDRVGKLEAILDAADVADVEVEVGLQSPREVAAHVLRAVGWTAAI